MKHIAWLSLLLACGPPSEAEDPSDVDYPAHEDGFTVLCHAEARSGAIATFPFAAKTATLNDWLTKELDDEFVRKLYVEQLPNEPLDRQGTFLRRRAAKAGVTPCPLGGLIDFLGQLSTVANAVDDCRAACVERHAEAEVADLETVCTTGCGG